MSEEAIGAEIKAALDEVWRPAPALLSRSMAAVREPGRRVRSWPQAAFSVAIALLVIATLVVIRHLSAGAPALPAAPGKLPDVSPVPITATATASQVAWVTGSRFGAVGVDPSGNVVGHVGLTLNPYLTLRTPDRTRLIDFGGNDVVVYAAADGTRVADIPRTSAGSVLNDAFSADSRFLAILVGPAPRVDVLDIERGRMVGSVALASAAQGPSYAAGNVVFTADGTIYAVSNWTGPAHLARIQVSGSGVRLIADNTISGGHPGDRVALCAGPGTVLRALPNGRLVSFCHDTGAVTFIDAAQLTVEQTLQPVQRNPFFLNPIFTPDAHLLLLQDGHSIEVVDLIHERLLGPVRLPDSADQPGPLAWLGVLDAEAGGVSSSNPISPDGRLLYQAENDGISVYRIPDLKLVAKLGAGVNVDEVWVSGDGRTVYGTIHGGGLLVVAADGSGRAHQVATVSGQQGFVAEAHG